MMDSVFHWMTALIGVAMVSALAEPFLTKPAMKQTLRIITAASLIAILLSPLLHPDIDAYASALRRERTSDYWDPDAAAEQDRLLNRMLIESECSAYILDKGKSLNVPVEEAHVTLRWDTEGYWVPERVQIIVTYETERFEALRDAIETDLGIAQDAQEWSTAHEP
jgi:hypothetical protein